ncbi:AAA family ATPase [Geobacillus thermoleovorans]|uniref:RNA-binding domain-containing protein n=1 Tax=Geobacillus thermoleovorans TaxID=33941 RepID=UPI00078BA502|nr:AAA family ATPase [Geobacillus thermoleovorans]
MDAKDLLRIIDDGENAELECKAAKGGLPKDVWETYSAFANTNGGIILLGVEQKGQEFFPVDVDAKKLVKDFWDGINNPQRISKNILVDRNVEIVEVDGKEIVKIYVPRASREDKPIYIGHNPFTGTYRRNYEGDYKCTKEEVQRMIADQSPIPQDSKVLPNYGLNDLNMESVRSYRNRFSSLKPDHPWNGLELKEFLYKIGALGRLRETNEEGLTLAGLLMFGEERSITEYLPQYFLEYREKSSDVPGERWTDRIISSDGTWSGNLYDFYFKVIRRLTDDLNIPFQMEGLFRKDDTRVHAALREALVNTLAHADYYGQRGIVIEKEKMLFRFSNPGVLRIPLQQALKGGISDPRNPTIFKMFMLIGLGERAGSGIENIHLAWKEQHWTAPELIEEFQPDRTILTLRTTSLLPQESVDFLKAVLGKHYKFLTNDEVLILVTAHQENYVTNTRLQSLTDKKSDEISKLLSGLVEKGYLEPNGQGRGTKYTLTEMFHQKSIGNSRYNRISSGPNVNNSGPNAANSGPNENEQTKDHEKVLLDISELARKKKRLNPSEMDEIILNLCAIKPLTLKELSQLLNRQMDPLRKKYISRLLKEGKLEPLYPEQINHPKQAYMTRSLFINQH